MKSKDCITEEYIKAQRDNKGDLWKREYLCECVDEEPRENYLALLRKKSKINSIIKRFIKD